jgi:hypothetical protein
MLPRSLPHFLFALGGALFTARPHGCRAKFLRPAYDAWTFAN